MSKKIYKMKIFLIDENGKRIPYEKSNSHIHKEKPRFKSEAEREAHRQGLVHRKFDRRWLLRQLDEDHGPKFEVVGPLGVVVNPHEMKINAILAKESGRVPIYYTMPRRSGKKIIRHFSETESEYSKVSYK